MMTVKVFHHVGMDNMLQQLATHRSEQHRPIITGFGALALLIYRRNVSKFPITWKLARIKGSLKDDGIGAISAAVSLRIRGVIPSAPGALFA